MSDEQPIEEQPIEEQPIEEPVKKPSTLSYDPAMLPPPINGYDQYVQAQLVEMRAIRKALGDINATLKQLVKSSK
jgi:hypothetical protein